eukprot:TRINITY_DN10617_c0_g1_i1.p1 TRINITY_DN10617_c0_g1~~TRINITY_DN10617_c0_g1_i1.p1  ORF type:complete len:198 (+),score=23.98 TRINITY_DN10617_c0_g1_i1:506-1099(+)
MSQQSYCVKCRVKTPSVQQQHTLTKNKKPAIKSKCQQCGSSKMMFVSSKSGGDIQKWITEKFPNTELHIPVVTHKGIEKAAFAGPGTKLEQRIKNLDENAQRVWEGKDVADQDIITKPKSSMDKAAMKHDLRYHHATRTANSKKDLLDMKQEADLHLIKDNVLNAFNPFDMNPIDRYTNLASIPAFVGKVGYEKLFG